METTRIEIDPDAARALYRKYKEHQNYSTPIDSEVRRTYQLLAQGKMIIKALESIKAAGVGEDGLPRLAICRADAETCWLRIEHNGAARMAVSERELTMWRRRGVNSRGRISFPAGTFAKPQDHRWSYEAMVPLIPAHLRPKRGLQNYHILWEAEWEKRVPVDPLLLRRIGKGDLWLVCAAWDLTEVERAALAARLVS